MNVFKSVPIKVSIFSIIYLIVLITIAPIMDHLFTDLKTDLLEKESESQIFMEVIMHIVVLSVVWYFIRNNLNDFLKHTMKVSIQEHTKTTIDIVSAIALVGLQKNLLAKLDYITSNHPVRDF